MFPLKLNWVGLDDCWKSKIGLAPYAPLFAQKVLPDTWDGITSPRFSTSTHGPSQLYTMLPVSTRDSRESHKSRSWNLIAGLEYHGELNDKGTHGPMTMLLRTVSGPYWLNAAVSGIAAAMLIPHESASFAPPSSALVYSHSVTMLPSTSVFCVLALMPTQLPTIRLFRRLP